MTQKLTPPKFKTAYNREFKEYKINGGKKIYEWEYLDEKGDLVKDKKDMYEYIQSFEASTNIKEKIKREEELIDDGKSVYLDVTKLGTTADSINEYLGSVISKVQQEFAKNQRIVNSKETGKDSKENAQTQQSSGEIDTKGGTE